MPSSPPSSPPPSIAGNTPKPGKKAALIQRERVSESKKYDFSDHVRLVLFRVYAIAHQYAKTPDTLLHGSGTTRTIVKFTIFSAVFPKTSVTTTVILVFPGVTGNCPTTQGYGSRGVTFSSP